MRNLNEYLLECTQRGVIIREDVVGFIEFGKNLTRATEQQVIAAIELTMLAQKEFDGSFFISMLELMQANFLRDYYDVLDFVRVNKLLAL